MERAVVKAVDQSSSPRRMIHETGDLPMHAIHVVFSVSAASDTALVGDDDESISRITKPPEAIRDPVQEDDARRIAQIAVVGDERVVSIKKDHRIHES